jgi:hypothetical protein
LNVRIILVYEGLKSILRLSASASVDGNARRPRSAATPGAVGLAGQNASSAGLPFLLPDQYRRIRLTIFP